MCDGSGATTLDKTPADSNAWFAHRSDYGILGQVTYSNMLLITDFQSLLSELGMHNQCCSLRINLVFYSYESCTGNAEADHSQERTDRCVTEQD